MHALGRRIDVAGQRVSVGRLELGDLPPFQDLLRQHVALLGELVEYARAGRPLSGLGLGAAGQLHFAEQDVAQLLGRARIEVGIAGKLAHLVLQRGAALCEFTRETREHLPVDRDAAPFHARQHRQQRPLQRLVHGHHALGDHAGFEHLRQAQRNVRVLGDVGRGLLHRGVVEGDLRLSCADHVVVVDRRVIEVARRQRIERMAEAAGIENVGHQHRVLVRLHLDAAHREHLQFVFQVLPDLEDAPVFKELLERRERVILRDLIRIERAAEQIAGLAIAAPAVRERDVTGLVRRDRERDAAERRLHRVDAERLDVDRDDAFVIAARDPRLQAVEAAHDLVARPVDPGGKRRLDFRGCECLRHALEIRRGSAGTRLRRHAAAGERQAGGCRRRGTGCWGGGAIGLRHHDG